MTNWGFPDFDAHEGVHLFTDPASGLQAVIAVHSTHLGPAAGARASGIMPPRRSPSPTRCACRAA